MLHAAAHSGHASTVELLLSFGLQHQVPVDQLVTPDTIAAALNEKPMDILIKFQEVDSSVFSRKMHSGLDLLTAASYGGPNSEDVPRSKYRDLARHLLDAGFDPNPTAWARRRGHPCHLYNACSQASCEIVESFLEHGALIKGSDAMRSASSDGRVDVLELLLKYGGDVNEVSLEKYVDGPPGTPLHVAVAKGREDVVRWLVGHGADVGVRNSEGKVAKEYLGEDNAGAILGILGEDGE